MHSGLVAAVHTPFTAAGDINLEAVPVQAAKLSATGVEVAFVCGSTGEFASLTVDERFNLIDAWSLAAPSAGLRFAAHVGSNCLKDSQALAEFAQTKGASAIASLAPCYFKPSLEGLLSWCGDIAASAPNLPFYYYDIPQMTGVHYSMSHFLRLAGERIPNFRGIKYTNPDLMTFQKCLHLMNRRFEMLWGTDESLLSALAIGARGAIGSSYNFAAPIYTKLIEAFDSGDLETAQEQQMRAVRLIALLSNYGYLAASKATMGFIGIDVGQTRLPNERLCEQQTIELEKELRELGFFDWIN